MVIWTTLIKVSVQHSDFAAVSRLKSYLFVQALQHVYINLLILPDATHFQTANHRIMLNPYASITKIDFSHSECVYYYGCLARLKARENR
jgi:hypothetical protein